MSLSDQSARRNPSLTANASCDQEQLRQRSDFLKTLKPNVFKQICAQALRVGAIEEARCALAAGADPSRAMGPHQSTPLMLAAQAGRMDLIDLLLPLANRDAVDTSQETALFYAILGHNGGLVVPVLLSAGLDPNHLNDDGDSPLMIALDRQADQKAILALALVCDMGYRNELGESCDQIEARLNADRSWIVRRAFAQRQALAEREQLAMLAPAQPSRAASRRM